MPSAPALVCGTSKGGIRVWELAPSNTVTSSSGGSGSRRKEGSKKDATEQSVAAKDLPGHQRGVVSLCVSRDGSWVVSTSSDGETRLLDLTSGASEASATVVGKGE
ncbi:hypothetical protein FRB99_004194, partial [Tulasnella sp. 403]